MIQQMVDATDGIICDIQAAIASFQFKERRAKKPMAWKVPLQIGPEIQVNVEGYIQIRRENPKTWKKCLAKSKGASAEDEDELKADVTFVKNNENQEVIEQEEIVQSYKYGKELVTVPGKGGRIIIAFSLMHFFLTSLEEVQENNKYEGGDCKSMAVIGFVNQDQIQRQYLLGDGCMIFQPVENDEHARIAISAIAYAMYDLNQVALVRRVYRKGSTPRIGALIPEYREDEDGNRELVRKS
jgi:ATP-dependent DNA helicase 2 subunit 2